MASSKKATTQKDNINYTKTDKENFEIGTFIFGDGNAHRQCGEEFYTIKILKKTKCFIHIKGNNWKDKVRCKILKDKKGFYIKPYKAFNGIYDTFKLYDTNFSATK